MFFFFLSLILRIGLECFAVVSVSLQHRNLSVWSCFSFLSFFFWFFLVFGFCFRLVFFVFIIPHLFIFFCPSIESFHIDTSLPPHVIALMLLGYIYICSLSLARGALFLISVADVCNRNNNEIMPPAPS